MPGIPKIEQIGLTVQGNIEIHPRGILKALEDGWAEVDGEPVGFRSNQYMPKDKFIVMKNMLKSPKLNFDYIVVIGSGPKKDE